MKHALLSLPLIVCLMGFTTGNRTPQGYFIAALVDSQVTRAKLRCEETSELCPMVKENLTLLATDIEALCAMRNTTECQGLLDSLDYIHSVLITL